MFIPDKGQGSNVFIMDTLCDLVYSMDQDSFYTLFISEKDNSSKSQGKT